MADLAKSGSSDQHELIASAKESLKLLLKTDASVGRGEFDGAISLLRTLISVSPYSSSLRERLAHCSIHLKDYEVAGSEFGQAFKYGGNVSYLYYAARSHLAATHLEKSLSSVQACLKSDPDNSYCLALFKLLRRLDKQYNSLMEKPSQKIPGLLKLWDEVNTVDVKLHLEQYPLTIGHRLLVAIALAEEYLRTSEFGDAIKWVEVGLQIQDSNEKLLKVAINAYFGDEEYEKG